MMQCYYEQNQREQLLRNRHRLSSPMYTENINQLNSKLGQSTINGILEVHLVALRAYARKFKFCHSRAGGNPENTRHHVHFIG